MFINLNDKEQKDCCPFKKANDENANFSGLLVRMLKQETQTQLELIQSKKLEK